GTIPVALDRGLGIFWRGGMGEILGNLATGFINAVQLLNFLMIVVGLAIGIIAGALPGITMLNSIVLVLPFTYLMGIVPALLLMIGVYCGGVFGGSITGILFNIPEIGRAHV